MAVDGPFPNLRNYTRTSDESDDYNCIAHACGFADRWIWPGRHWPRGFRSTPNTATFQALFAVYGYEPCENGTLEHEYEKIALYGRDNQPKHAAKQLADGAWTSKLGRSEDITHADPAALEGPLYGRVVMFFRRKRKMLSSSESGTS